MPISEQPMTIKTSVTTPVSHPPMAAPPRASCLVADVDCGSGLPDRSKQIAGGSHPPAATRRVPLLHHSASTPMRPRDARLCRTVQEPQGGLLAGHGGQTQIGTRGNRGVLRRLTTPATLRSRL